MSLDIYVCNYYHKIVSRFYCLFIIEKKGSKKLLETKTICFTTNPLRVQLIFILHTYILKFCLMICDNS